MPPDTPTLPLQLTRRQRVAVMDALQSLTVQEWRDVVSMASCEECEPTGGDNGRPFGRIPCPAHEHVTEPPGAWFLVFLLLDTRYPHHVDVDYGRADPHPRVVAERAAMYREAVAS